MFAIGSYETTTSIHSFGRTHTENSPGLSIIAPDGALDLEALIGRQEVVGVHRGRDAARAWSYGRVVAKP